MKKLVIVILLLIVILIMSTVLAVTQKEKDFTKKLYKDMCENDTYSFVMYEKKEQLDYNLIVAEDQDSLSIDVKSNDEHTTTLVIDETAYYVMHNEEEYYLYDSGLTDGNFIKNGLAEIENKKYLNGSEKIKGKSYYYEEYEGISSFLILSDDKGEEIRTRFYFDNGNIVYIKNFVGQEEELIKVDFSKEVEKSLFDIPDNYAEL